MGGGSIGAIDRMSVPPPLSNLFFKRFYLFDTEREPKEGEQHAEGEGKAGSLPSREPNVGLDPSTLGS